MNPPPIANTIKVTLSNGLHHIKVSLCGGICEQSFRAHISQGLALHYWQEYGYWTITHVRSGHAVLTNFRRFVDAVQCRKELLETPIDWTGEYDEVKYAALDNDDVGTIYTNWRVYNLAMEVGW